MFHEIISTDIHLDVHVVEPSVDDPNYTIFTTGMSDLPMNMPKELLQDYSHLQRTELVMFVPSTWEIEKIANKDVSNEIYWVVGLIKSMARFPHEYKTWISHGHTIPNGSEYTPFASNTKLSCSLMRFLCAIETHDDNALSLLQLVPITKEEAEYKLEFGADALVEKLDEASALNVIIADRDSVV